MYNVLVNPIKIIGDRVLFWIHGIRIIVAEGVRSKRIGETIE